MDFVAVASKRLFGLTKGTSLIIVKFLWAVTNLSLSIQRILGILGKNIFEIYEQNGSGS